VQLTPVPLEIDAVTKTYPGAAAPVLRDVSLTLAPGTTLALTGESGSGKSTLLHLAGALDSFETGEIRLGDIAYSTLTEADRADLRRARVALVFQQFNLVGSMTVAANLSFHARLAGRSDPTYEAALARRLGLEPLLEAYPEQLSGGQQQRVAIGRALAMRPTLLLADEPTGNLDEATGDTVLALMLDLVRDSGCSLLLVTHSERVAAQLDARAHLSRGRLE
jgi:putative ABC transport system ATP-binding protein